MELPPQLPRLEAAARALSSARALSFPGIPEVALVLGSGLGGFADSLADRLAIPYAAIPGMPSSAVAGHAGNLVFGKVAGMPVVAMQGRVHLYEGHAPADVVFGVRLMRHLGAESLLITNAAGGCGEGLQAGDLMRITDHLNLTGRSPLLGPNEDSLGPRFPDMTQAYDRELGALAEEVAAAAAIPLKRGVYAGLLGPAYETPAEVRMLQRLGADAVGMSTVLEVLAARHMGQSVLGISCITNAAAGLGQETLDHAEVTEVAARVRGRFETLLRGVLEKIAATA
jgi:purine-nucleoside phosphorylase